ncbi:MAG: DUF1553 domain-containing protein [Planctomycetes bacterium]|nr:DUF1553 domain-containing protein [Planctomycetota bacterium]
MTRGFPVCLAVLFALAAPAAAGDGSWAFTPPRKPTPPTVRDRTRIANPIDAFVFAKLDAHQLTLSAPADCATLLRRITLDLTGLPPTVAEQEAFLNDTSADAYRRVVDRLLSSPHYGERWAQHWLDLVRYAESDGFKADEHRPAAHRYRDYIIQALNADLPYDRFIHQQLAGDELEPDNPDALVATGLNRLWPDEYNAANLEQRWQEILDDVTETTGAVFLGLTVGCARCHDHKFDPTSQVDYFSLQAFFAPMKPRDDLAAASAAAWKKYQRDLVAWEKTTKPIREEMEKLVAKRRANARAFALGKFRAEIQQAALTPPEKRTPYQEQIASIAEKQCVRAEQEAPQKLPPVQKKRYDELARQLNATRPKAPPEAMAVTDVGRQAPATHRLQGGAWFKPKEEVQPGFPAFLGKATPDTRIRSDLDSTGRRAALARWLTRKDHPLTARVIVNRLWQHHFGVGIVATASDFGAQGEAPTHPELLDWLAVELVESGWSLKHLHRLMVTSATYCQSSRVDPKDANHVRALAADRDNKLLWHARRRRLEGEALRDAMLQLSGELNLRMYGPSARPKLPEGVSKYAWKPDAREEDQHRRSIYVLAQRNMRYPLFDVFDLPDMHNSCSRRAQTTTPPQALLLLNGEFTRERAARWAAVLWSRSSDSNALVAAAYRFAWGRMPTAEEVGAGGVFIRRQTELRRGNAAEAVADFCHAVLNSNEMLYVD